MYFSKHNSLKNAQKYSVLSKDTLTWTSTLILIKKCAVLQHLAQ